MSSTNTKIWTFLMMGLKFLIDSKDKTGTVDYYETDKETEENRKTSLQHYRDVKLTDHSREGLVRASTESFYKYGKEFDKVIINSGYRTHGRQAEYFVIAS